MAIAAVIEKTLGIGEQIMTELRSGSKTFQELNALIFKTPSVQMAMGVRMLESHLVRLVAEGLIVRSGTSN